MNDRNLKTSVSLRDWVGGEPISATKLNETVDAVRKLYQSDIVGLPGVVETRPLIAKRFRVKAMYADHIECTQLDREGNETTRLFEIAKPYLLRRTPFDGVTRNGITYTYNSDTERVADDGSTTETQVIIPSYHFDDGAQEWDEIIAARVIIGGTGVTPATTQLIWLDLNVDGRAWAKKFGT